MNEQIVINGQLLSYTKQGSQHAQQTLIFLHGWRSNAQVWRPVVESFKLSSYQVYAIDLPGFGGSPASKTDWPLDRLGTPPSKNNYSEWGVGDYANLIAEFITKLNLKNVIVVGHSFGGRVGIKLASSRADLVKKLVLVDAAGFVMENGKKSAIELLAKIVKPFFKPKFMQGLRKKIYKTIGAEDYIATPELQKIFVKVVSEDLTESMKRILQPTLIIWGEKDRETPVSTGERMYTLIPNSKFQILNSSGHFSFLDQPAEFVEVLKEFIY